MNPRTGMAIVGAGIAVMAAVTLAPLDFSPHPQPSPAPTTSTSTTFPMSSTLTVPTIVVPTLPTVTVPPVTVPTVTVPQTPTTTTLTVPATTIPPVMTIPQDECAGSLPPVQSGDDGCCVDLPAVTVCVGRLFPTLIRVGLV